MWDCLVIILSSIGAGLLSEAVSWLLVYRTEDYQRKTAALEKLQAKVDKQKAEAVSITDRKKKEKRNASDEQELARLQQSLTVMRMQTTIANMVIFLSTYNIISSQYDGIRVAKLPFHPFGFIRGISHRNLISDDFTDCSCMFIYTLSSIGLRANITKWIGNAPAKGLNASSMFSPPPGAAGKW